MLPEITLQPYTQVQRHLCCGAQEEKSLRLLEKEKTVSCLCAVSEKQFNFTQDAPLPEGEHPEDLLLVRLCPGVSSLQRVGNKFSLKGEMAVYALYCDEARALRTYQGTLPIAEVLEAGGAVFIQIQKPQMQRGAQIGAPGIDGEKLLLIPRAR